jgi:hypothetical protein
MKKKTVSLSGYVRYEPELPYEFTNTDVGDIVVKNGWPHIVIDAGKQGKKIAAFKEPYGWKVEKKT